LTNICECDKDFSGLSLNETLTYYLFNEFANIYGKALVQLSGKALEEVTEEFSELSLSVKENLNLTAQNSLRIEDKNEVIGNLCVINYYSCLFKASLIEENLNRIERLKNVGENKEKNNEKTEKDDIIKKSHQFFQEKNEFDSNIILLKPYFIYLANINPLTYLDILLNYAAAIFLKTKSLKKTEILDLIEELIKGWKTAQEYSKILKEPYEVNLLSEIFIPSLKSLIILIVISLFKNLNGLKMTVLLRFLEANADEFQFANNLWIINHLNFAFFSAYNSDFVLALKAQAKVFVNSKELNCLNDEENGIFQERIVNFLILTELAHITNLSIISFG